MSESIARRFVVTPTRVGLSGTFRDVTLSVSFPKKAEPAEVKRYIALLVGHMATMLAEAQHEVEVQRETADLDGELALLFEPPADCETPEPDQA